ncbi:MAG TPA: tetratricopeptide repeat protein [Polyangia bacterium]|nr:tetratricopeptide repeat protein [Polyangia bacterium]
MPTVREYEAALQKNPADTEAFVALRKTYRQAQKHDRLVTLYETRAQAIEDNAKAGELFYLAAELRLDQLGDAQGAEADLVNAVDRDPGHIRAAARLKDIYREQGRTADYMTMLEMEAAAVARTRDPARLAELEAEMGQLFLNHFAKLERAVRNPQRAGKLGAEHLKSIESARKIYRALGDWRSVVRLYELELEGTSDARRRADLLLGLGRVLGEKLEELDAAAQRLSEAVRIRPRDEKALELLAAVYANPNWIGADGLDRAATIYYQVGRRRQEAGDTDNAIASLRKALQVVPGHTESSELLERVYYDARRFQELDRYYRERISAAPSEAERIDFLYKRAQLAEGELGDRVDAQRIYNEISLLEPAGGPAAEKLAELYIAGHEYAKLAELRERQLGAIAEPTARARIMLELATLYRDRLGDGDQAAVYLHAVLEIEPENQVALAAYAEHFREKGDWAALADLLEFSYERARVAGAATEELLPRLEEIAAVAEKQLGDPERALAAWMRAEELAPTHARAREAQRRILLKAKSWDRLAALLEREAAAQTDATARIDVLRRVAQLHREKLANPKRAIEIYREVLRADPLDAVSMRALVEIYEREGDWKGLAAALREQIGLTTAKQERVGLLRRVLVIYDERTGDLVQGQWAANEILQSVPGDRDTLVRLERILDRAGQPADLVHVLEMHAQHAANPDEKLQLYRRIAEILYSKLQDPTGAAARLEEVVRLDPDDAKALAGLRQIYETLGRHEDLARALDMEVERVIADASEQSEFLRQLARLVEGTIGDRARARKAWEQLSDLLPTDPEALEALARLYTAEEDWPMLVRILERQAPLATEPDRAVALTLQRAQLFDDKLNDVNAATETLERLIAEVDPRNVEAHARLRAYYERAEDWARVVKIAERQLFLTEDRAERVRRSMELATLIRDRLNDDKKAISIYERVLEIDPDHRDALEAVAGLYGTTGNYQRLAYADEKLLEATEDPEERRKLLLQIGEIYEKHLEDPARGFEWFRRAYLENPTAENLQVVDGAADRHGLYEELIQIYEGARERAGEPIEHLAASLKIALICEEKLDDPTRAFRTLVDALPSDPAGDELLHNLERLAERTGDWKSLLDVYAQVARARTETEERVELLRLRAEVRERRMNDPSAALDETLRSFAIEPRNPRTHEEILRLSRITGRWEEAIRVQGQLFALAEELPEKLTIARNAAHLVEHEVKDLIRAFRAYLNAFRLAPDDEEVVGHLWRLAAEIGRYDHGPAEPAADHEAPAQAEPQVEAVADEDGLAAGAQSDEAIEEGGGDEGGDLDVVSVHVDVDEEVAEVVAGEAAADVAAADEGEGDDDDVGGEVTPAPVVAEAGAGDSGALAIEDDDAIEVIEEDELVEDEANEAAARPPATPAGPHEDAPFATPWEELAAAYEALPAEDADDRWVYLRKIAEVWERGQHDVERALDALERAFRLDISDVDVRAELERIADQYERWDRLAKIYLGAIDEFGAIETAVTLHHDAARVRERLGQIAEAEELYRAILRIRSDDPIAIGRVEEICRTQERWEDLANILEQRTGAPTESLPNGPERRARLRELAALYEARLERPYEAIDTLERLLRESSEEERGTAEPPAPAETLAAHEALVRLYSRVGLWAKVVDILQAQSELVGDRDQARALRIEVAGVYERELTLPDRAIEAYEAVLAEIPDDAQTLEALDRLHESTGRYDDLQEVLKKRAALATGSTRLEIVRRRARILQDRLNNPEAAAAALRDLGAEAIADDDLLAVMLRNLRRAGLAHEAARVLQQRIDLERSRPGKESATSDRIAELSLELSLLKLDDLNDPLAARKEVEAALQASPDNPAALAALARLHLKANDFAGYSAARVREAKALSGRPEAVEALLDAGRVYREQLAQPAQARACFEAALREAPSNPEALQALAALLAAESNWDEARKVLGRQLEITTDPTARATVLSDLARVAWEGFSDGAEAQRHLEEALALVPDHLPAILEIADIYYKEGQWEQAEKRLSEAVRRLRHQPQQATRLFQRLAEVHEKTGKLDEAYRQLLEADKMGPGQLLTKLSLGQNRFRAGKWREAAVHLGSLAEHPDAALYPDEVADALGHAAQAEIKLRRPERAIELYEAALGLRAGHRPSLRALADLALERGEREKAASYLRRLSEEASDRAERAQTLEQLGDLYLEVHDEEQALWAYHEARKAFGGPSEEQVGLLEKTLKLQRSRGDVEGAAETSATLIDLVKDPQERAERRRDAAVLLAEQGNVGDAAALLDHSLAENPNDEAALAALCDLADRLPRGFDLDARLARALAELPPPGDQPAARARRATLWQQHAELLEPKDPKAAIAAYEQVVALTPEQLPAREALAVLYGEAPEHEQATLENHRQLLNADITRSSSLRALGSLYLRRGQLDRTRCCYELLALLGTATPAERTFLEDNRAPELKPDDPYAGIIDERDRSQHLSLGEATVMSEIFSCLWAGAPGLVGQKLEDFGVSSRDKVSPMAEMDLGRIYGQVAKALGNKKTALYVRAEGATEGLTIAVQAPPALVVAPALADGASPTEIRFQIARGLELTRPEYILAAGVRPKQFTAIFASVLRAFHPRHAKRRTAAGDVAAEQAAKLKKNVPYKVSKQLVELFQRLGNTSWSSLRWRTVVHQIGNRTGLVMCGDLATAAQIVVRDEGGLSAEEAATPETIRRLATTNEPLRELLRFAISEDYFVLREKLGTALAKAAAA